ncbi:MAG: hypothetical protein A2033_16770 [Bacteroidetes bacterium GWA2_31_9]|nr:MAG: hypothetical protein A2033_16770 [Bacteroidetes bacterium GWA2_31_9]
MKNSLIIKKAMIIEDLATDCTNFTHKSNVFKGIRESLRYVHRFKTTKGCFICANSKKSVKQICVN